MATEQTTGTMLDATIERLRQGATDICSWTVAERIRLLERCIDGVGAVTRSWVESACTAKRIPADSPARAEEITAGPVPTLRHLQLLRATLQDLAAGRSLPRLPGKPRHVGGQWRVPVFPTRSLYDSLIFRPLTAETWLSPELPASMAGLIEPFARSQSAASTPRVACVLGAGNVTSISATDTLSKIFQEGQAVLLKINPVTDYLQPILEQAFRPLCDAKLLHIVSGDGTVGAAAVQHPGVDTVHITGATATHDKIVWGNSADQQQRNRAAHTPLLKKPITSELGNVTPWIIVPGNYSAAELDFQAANIAASITNNCSFNCIATKLIVTARDWNQRHDLLDRIDRQLAQVPRRYAYYPGARERFARFAEQTPSDDYLPWTLRRNMDPQSHPLLVQEESFVPVCAEVTLPGDTAQSFLNIAVEFVNEAVWGTLAASLTVPRGQEGSPHVCSALSRLRYGTIGINLWSAVSFALCSPPWGAFPGNALTEVGSGQGFVHNTYLLPQPQKTIVRAPLRYWPKPIWFPSHRFPERLAWRLLDVSADPRWRNLPALVLPAAGG